MIGALLMCIYCITFCRWGARSNVLDGTENVVPNIHLPRWDFTFRAYFDLWLDQPGIFTSPIDDDESHLAVSQRADVLSMRCIKLFDNLVASTFGDRPSPPMSAGWRRYSIIQILSRASMYWTRFYRMRFALRLVMSLKMLRECVFSIVTKTEELYCRSTSRSPQQQTTLEIYDIECNKSTIFRHLFSRTYIPPNRGHLTCCTQYTLNGQ
jgi:hypothetical protein